MFFLIFLMRRRVDFKFLFVIFVGDEGGGYLMR